MDTADLKRLAEGAQGDGYTEDGAFMFRLNGPSAMLELIAYLEKIKADRKECWEEFKIQSRRMDRIKNENELFLGLLHMSKELLTTISHHSETLRQLEWCDNFKSEVASKIEKLDAAIAGETK